MEVFFVRRKGEVRAFLFDCLGAQLRIKIQVWLAESLLLYCRITFSRLYLTCIWLCSCHSGKYGQMCFFFLWERFPLTHDLWIDGVSVKAESMGIFLSSLWGTCNPWHLARNLSIVALMGELRHVFHWGAFCCLTSDKYIFRGRSQGETAADTSKLVRGRFSVDVLHVIFLSVCLGGSYGQFFLQCFRNTFPCWYLVCNLSVIVFRWGLRSIFLGWAGYVLLL